MRDTKLIRALKAVTLSFGMVGLGMGSKYVYDKLTAKNPNFVREGTYEGYPTTIGLDGGGRGICITDSNAWISAKDYDNDGRFDEITFRSLPKGHPLEKLANLETLENAYESVRN